MKVQRESTNNIVLINFKQQMLLLQIFKHRRQVRGGGLTIRPLNQFMLRMTKFATLFRPLKSLCLGNALMQCGNVNGAI